MSTRASRAKHLIVLVPAATIAKLDRERDVLAKTRFRVTRSDVIRELLARPLRDGDAA